MTRPDWAGLRRKRTVPRIRSDRKLTLGFSVRKFLLDLCVFIFELLQSFPELRLLTRFVDKLQTRVLGFAEFDLKM